MLQHAEEQAVDQRAPRLRSTWRSRRSSRYPISPTINHCPVTQQEASLCVPKACRAIKLPSYFPILHRAACERTVNTKAYVHWAERSYETDIKTHTVYADTHENVHLTCMYQPGAHRKTVSDRNVLLFISCLLQWVTVGGSEWPAYVPTTSKKKKKVTVKCSSISGTIL